MMTEETYLNNDFSKLPDYRNCIEYDVVLFLKPNTQLTSTQCIYVKHFEFNSIDAPKPCI